MNSKIGSFVIIVTHFTSFILLFIYFSNTGYVTGLGGGSPLGWFQLLPPSTSSGLLVSLNSNDSVWDVGHLCHFCLITFQTSSVILRRVED